MRSRAVPYARFETRRNQMVAATRGRRTVPVARKSAGFMISRTTATPTRVRTLTTALMSPFCRRVDSASTSVVMRVMIRPAISRS